MTIHHLTDQNLGLSRDVYAAARSEKDARATLSSAIKRLLTRDAIVVADAMNYIKGFRYQLYCEAKAVQTPNCVVSLSNPVFLVVDDDGEGCGNLAALDWSSWLVFEHTILPDKRSIYIHGCPMASKATHLLPSPPTPTTFSNHNTPNADFAEIHIGTPVDKCRELNAAALESGSGGYAPELFENLVFRYEEPNGMTRWDSPLFTVPYDDATPPLDAIWDALIGSDGNVKLVRPNAATVLKPATETNYLYELDRTTSDIVAAISAWQRDHEGEAGGEVAVQGVESVIELPSSPLALPQLQRLRRAFIGLNRQHSLTKDRIGALFVDYLNDAFAK